MIFTIKSVYLRFFRIDMFNTFKEVIHEVGDGRPCHPYGLMMFALVYQFAKVNSKYRELFAEYFLIRVAKHVVFFAEVN